MLLVLAALLPGCSKGCGKSGSGRLEVAVSIFPIYDLVRRVAGPDADVHLLLKPGRNEHTFDPTPKEIEAAARCKVGVMVGLGLDPWMEKLMKEAAPEARVIKVGDRVPTIPIKEEAIGHDDDAEHAHEHEVGAPDPHVWLDPQRAQLIVRAVAEEMGRADTPHALDYRKRATEIDDALGALDREVDEKTKVWKTRGFVTFHGSFGYFADRYKLEILAMIEPFPGSQPSGETITKVLDIVRKKNVAVVYSEPQLDPRPAKVLADEAKVALGVLDPVGGGPETDSYEKMIRFDVAALEKYMK